MSATLDRPQAAPESFVPTPEQLQKLPFLKLKKEEIHDMFLSAERRQKLLKELLAHADDIKALHPDFDPKALPERIEEVSTMLAEKEKFVEAADSPEKKSIYRRAWETVKSFPKNHPFITAALAIALITAGAIRLGYITLPNFGEWWAKLKALLKGKFGIGQDGAKFGGAGNAAGEAAESVGEAGASGLPDVVQRAMEAAKVLSPGPNDFIVAGRQILFNGKVYEASNLAPLAEALKSSGLGSAESIRILRDSSARVTAWQGLQSFLVENGIDAQKIILHKDLLQSGQ